MNPKLGKKGILFIISAPSGTGKSTLSKKLLAADKNLKLSVSHTTRKPRENETNGREYYFINKEKFTKMIVEDEFVEYVTNYNNYYGTSKSEISKYLNQGCDIILDIDPSGARELKKIFLKRTVTIFIFPPSIEELSNRLDRRNTKDNVKQRLLHAYSDIKSYKEYDHLIINDDIDDTFLLLQAIIRVERNKKAIIKNLDKFIEQFK